jgi:hypothetical protein
VPAFQNSCLPLLHVPISTDSAVSVSLCRCIDFAACAMLARCRAGCPRCLPDGSCVRRQWSVYCTAFMLYIAIMTSVAGVLGVYCQFGQGGRVAIGSRIATRAGRRICGYPPDHRRPCALVIVVVSCRATVSPSVALTL